METVVVAQEEGSDYASPCGRRPGRAGEILAARNAGLSGAESDVLVHPPETSACRQCNQWLVYGRGPDLDARVRPAGEATQ